jgi:hypothetical protein
MSDITLIIPPSTTPTPVTISITATVGPSATPAPAPLPTPIPKLTIGTNLLANDSIQGAAAWCDVTRQCSGWYGVGAAKITYDANGYPATVTGGQAACFTYLFGYPTGNYALSWKGPAIGLSVPGKTVQNIVSDGAGGCTATVAFSSGDRCEFRRMGGITAISLLAPDAKPGRTYRDAFLALVKPYAVIRLMPAQRVNGVGFPPTLRTNWATRVTPNQWDWTTNEVPAEALAELCVESGCTPWVCVPYSAPDDYVTALATVFKACPGAYFELSNELWNVSPAYQGNQIRADGVKAGLATDPNVAGAKLHGQLTAHMGKLVKAVIPGAKIVLGAQAGWEAWAANASTVLKPGDVDCLAVAPYFQPADGMPVDTVANILKACQAWIDGPLATGLKANAAVAQKNGWTFVGYEWNQSLSPNPANAPPVELIWQGDISPAQYAAYLADPATAAQTDPGMGVLIDNVLSLCRSVGMTLACHFMAIGNHGRSGMWGARQQLTDGPNVITQALARAITASAP